MGPVVGLYRELADAVSALSFQPPVEYVYNPLTYAWPAYHTYLRRFATPSKRVIFLGMNPGPFGMAQTGIPFGDVRTVGEWLGIRDELRDLPERMHAKRPILGLSCRRIEVSGDRLWGWVRSRWCEPERFFDECFVANYCPLVFLEESGRNRTPDKLKPEERSRLFSLCDEALVRLVNLLEAEWLIAIGAFAEVRARECLGQLPGLRILRILHPSPANPAANRGWAGAVEEQLDEHGVFRINEAESGGGS